MNTGTVPVPSSHGLLTTLGYKLGDAPAVYALEGSIAIAGALVQWLRDNLGLIDRASDIEGLAASVEDNGGAYIVPAFSGLFAPYWRSDARGVIAGLTRYVTKGHLARATLEATAYQTREVIDAMHADSGVPLTSLRVDGGMVANALLMQFQSDILGVPVIRPVVTETTALGAPTPPVSQPVTGATLTSCGQTGDRMQSGIRRWRNHDGGRCLLRGRRRSPGRSTGRRDGGPGAVRATAC